MQCFVDRCMAFCPFSFGHCIVALLRFTDSDYPFGIFKLFLHASSQGVVVVVIVWWLDLQLPVQSVPITTKVVSSNPVLGEVYSIQHYVIKIVSDLRQVGGSL